MFQQRSFKIFQRLESLLLDSLTHEIESLKYEIYHVNSIYDVIDVGSLSAQLFISHNDGENKALII